MKAEKIQFTDRTTERIMKMKKSISLLFAAFLGIGSGLRAEELPATPENWDWKINNEDYAVLQKKDGNVPHFRIFGPVTLLSKKLFPVNLEGRYKLSFELRGNSYTTSPGFECFDKNQKVIDPVNVNYVIGSETTLAAPCTKGDTILKVKPAKQMWKKSPHLAIAFDTKADFSDLPNRNVTKPGIQAVRKKGAYWEITLKNPCGFDYPAGKNIRLHSAFTDSRRTGMTAAPGGWIRRSLEPSMDFTPGQTNTFYPGTCFVRVKLHVNSDGESKGLISDIRNMAFEKYAFTIKKLYNTPVAYEYPLDKVSPNSIIKTNDGRLLVGYGDKGDIAAGCSTYYSESKDGGRTWDKAKQLFIDKNPLVGTIAQMIRMPDGRILLATMRAWCKGKAKNSADQIKRSLRMYLTLDLSVSDDNGKTFRFLQKVGDGRYSVIATGGSNIVELANGDWILPVYAYSPWDNKKGKSGCGFIRSTDKGKTWGGLEVAYRENPKKRLGFNEVAYAVKPDGKIVGFARIDGVPVSKRYLYKVVSADNGKTWSNPVPTKIKAIYPDILKLDNGIYVMVCGVRDVPGCPQQPHIFLSKDGENFQDMGSVYYSRPAGWNGKQDPRCWGTGSSQCLEKASPNSFYVAFEGSDPALPQTTPYSRHYMDFNHFEVNFAK